MKKLIFATRPSKLARWQTNHVIETLQAAWTDLVCEEVVITTKGDKVLDRPLPEIGGKGLFTEELEAELLAGRVDAAVHSLKDLPVENPSGLTVGLIPERVNVQDVLICPAGHTLATLPEGAVVGTSSLRRQAQLLAFRPDLQVRSIRGNVDTRIRKVEEGQYDAGILAAAGITRLGLEEHVAEWIDLDLMLPAPAQGALGVQCRADDEDTINALKKLEHKATRLAVLAERAFLLALGGGCSIPVGAYATVTDELIQMTGIVAATDGSKIIKVSGENTDCFKLGEELAQAALAQGAAEVLHG